jgi:hypothetical protein
MDSLLTEPDPLGGLVDLAGWEGLYDAWVGFLEQRDPDTRLLGALQSLRQFLSADDLEWSRKGQERDRIEGLRKTKFSTAALRCGLGDERDRWLALQLIAEQVVRELLPEVRQAHEQKPGYGTINVLAKIGSKEDLEALRASIGTLVDLEARKQLPLSTENVFGPEHKHSTEYGQIVRAMARLATPGAVATIKSALLDYDPSIRAAGCEAVANLRSDLIDDEIRVTVRSRLTDSPPYVAKAARDAANAQRIED